MTNNDFLLEMRLKKLDSGLAERHSHCMSLFEEMLKKFLAVFPTFTDHTLLHTLTITNISNQLLGQEVDKLSAEEIYIYLMSTALHDIGMGVKDRDLDPFIDAIGARDFANSHPGMSKTALIRDFHNDFSSEFIKKYWRILDIPGERYAYAIAEVSRGHRKTDLADESVYQTDYVLDDGKQANLALLAALIRIADELDIASDRNPELLYNADTMENLDERDMFEFSKHRAINSVEYIGDTVVVHAKTDSPHIQQGVKETVRKTRETLDYCVSIARERSSVRFTCEKIKFFLNGEEIDV